MTQETLFDLELPNLTSGTYNEILRHAWLTMPLRTRTLPIGGGYTVTDLFCGGGGSSSGMIQIPGIWVRSAANHWDVAIQIHNANHPDTDHACVDLHQENPAFFPKTDVLWASPECTKWSQGSGGRYNHVSPEISLLDDELVNDDSDAEIINQSRLLMFDVLRFVAYHRYRLVFIENVVDIARNPKYRVAWDMWRRDLRALGYRFKVLSINSMHAQTYGMPAPQSRDRIYIVAWPENEREPDFEPVIRPDAYCPKCDVVGEGRQSWKNGRTVGKYRDQYVYVHAACGTTVEPGYLPAFSAIDWSIPGKLIGDRLKDKTRLRIAAGIARFWGPFHLEAEGNQYDAADPKHKSHGDPNGYYRTWGIDDVVRTLNTRETKALAIPMEGRDGKQAQTLDRVLRTQTTRLENGLVTPFISEFYGTSTGRPVTEAAGTFTAGGNHHALVSPYYSGTDYAKPIDDPLGTLTTVDRYALVHRNNTGSAEMTTGVLDYLRTLTTTGHQSLISAPERVRRQVTQSELDQAMELVPECMFRMFDTTEVAAGMAFPSTYNWQPPERAKPVSKRDITKAAGNSVCPPNARDLMGCGVEYLEAAA